MIKFISLQDLHLLTYDVTNVEHHFELLRQEVLDLTYPFLYSIGHDTQKQIALQACKHRSISNGVVVGYRVIGWQRKDKEWRCDPRCDLHLWQNHPDWKGSTFDLTEGALDNDDIDLTRGDVLESYRTDKESIRQLNEILRHVRGARDFVF